MRPDWGSSHRSGVIHISNMRDGTGESIGGLGSGELDWHTDQSYVANPRPEHALHGGDAAAGRRAHVLANLKLAWEALPESTKRRIEPLHVVYDYLLRQSTYDDEAPMSKELSPPDPAGRASPRQRPPGDGREGALSRPGNRGRHRGLAGGREPGPVSPRSARTRSSPPSSTAHEWQIATSSCGTTDSSCYRRDEFDPSALRWPQAHHPFPFPRTPHRPAVAPRRVARSVAAPAAATAAAQGGIERATVCRTVEALHRSTASPAGCTSGMKTAVSIPDDIFERAERLALASGAAAATCMQPRSTSTLRAMRTTSHRDDEPRMRRGWRRTGCLPGRRRTVAVLDRVEW